MNITKVYFEVQVDQLMKDVKNKHKLSNALKMETGENGTCSPVSNVTLNRGRIFDSVSLNTSILYNVRTVGSDQNIYEKERLSLEWYHCNTI